MAAKFYFCPHCGNVIIQLVDSSVVPHCCGEEMELLQAQTADTMAEKHVPVVTRMNPYCIEVQVGAEPHPMQASHYIAFVAAEGKHGLQVQYLTPNNVHKIRFSDCHGEVTAVYAYCNVHGLWKTTRIPQADGDCAHPKGMCNK